MPAEFGQLMGLTEACQKAGIHRATLNKYIELGYMPTYLDGSVVNYRELLIASWKAAQHHRANSGRASKNYGTKTNKK